MARIKGNSMTDVIEPKVKLINMSTYPLGAIVSMWIGSRFEETISPVSIERMYYEGICDQKDSKMLCEYYPEYSGDEGTDYKNVIKNIARMVVKSNLPPLDAVNFTFEIDNANVAWREQLVRSRHPQNFWMQTSRTADLTQMDVNRLQSIEEYGGSDAVGIYNSTVEMIREAYKDLVALGVPSEDIRLIPQGMTHRVYWMVSFRTLKSVISTRMSWIAQASLWSPIIAGVQEELFREVPFFAEELGVPSDITIEDGIITSHKYDNENEDRYYGRDYQPCDPLWLAYRGFKAPSHTNVDMYNKMKKMYIKMWSKEVCDILGWDKNDPDKLGSYDMK